MATTTGKQVLLAVPDRLTRRVDFHYRRFRQELTKSGRLPIDGAGFYTKGGEEYGMALRLDYFINPFLAMTYMGVPQNITAIPGLPAEALIAVAGLLAIQSFRDSDAAVWRLAEEDDEDLYWTIPEYYVLIGLVQLGGIHFMQHVRARQGWDKEIDSHFGSTRELAAIGFSPVRTFGRVCRVTREHGRVRFGRMRIIDSITGEGYLGGALWNAYMPSRS